MLGLLSRSLRTPCEGRVCWRRQIRLQSTSSFLLREPPSNALRQVPTPLAFVSASGWEPRTTEGLHDLSSMFVEAGYTCMDIDLSQPPRDSEALQTSQSLMRYFENELTSHLRLASASAGPFPPIIFSSGPGALITQTYISSNPASGLVLMSPPVTNASVAEALLPTPLDEFNFEPKFPIALVATRHEWENLITKNRLGKAVAPYIAKIEVEALEGQDIFVKIAQWLDRIGV